MKVPDATGGDLSASVSCSAAGGGGNTYGKKKKPSATPNAVPNSPPNRKITNPRQNRCMSTCPSWQLAIFRTTRLIGHERQAVATYYRLWYQDAGGITMI